MTQSQHWHQRIGSQRDWIWKGWQIRYTYMQASQPSAASTTPLILLHGFGACIEHWRNNIPVLSQKHSVYALDLLGFGASRKPPADYKIDLWVEQVYDFWQTFIRQPVVLVGNSIGSLVCFTAAATHPEMVKGIVMLSVPDLSLQSKFVSTIERVVASFPLLLNIIFRFVRQPKAIRTWAKIAYHNEAAITDELVNILVAPAQDLGASRTFSSLFQAVRRPQFALPAKAVLPNLKIPILLIWGRQDRMVPFSLASIIVQLNPLIKFVELDGAGHCPHDEYPDKFNQILLDWLDNNWNWREDTQPLSIF